MKDDNLKNMLPIVKRLEGSDTLPQLYSAKWVDANDVPLFFYLANRPKNANPTQVSFTNILMQLMTNLF